MRFARDMLPSFPGVSVPERFVVTPPDLRPANANLARDFYNGQFTFAGQTVQVGNGTPFSADAPSPEWAAELHGFRWLRHMAGASGLLPSAQAKTLVSDWQTICARKQRAPWQETGITAMRLIAFLQGGRFLLTGADHAFYRSFMRMIATHVGALQREASRAASPIARTRAHVALGLASLSLPVSESVSKKAMERLGSCLDETVLADGGFVSRNPDDLADIAADLLSLAKSCKALNQPVPAPVIRTLDRALPRLRSYVHGDGELATFCGARGGSALLVKALLSTDETAAKPTAHAPQAGFVTLHNAGSAVIGDVGVRQSRITANAYQSLSAVEFSNAGERLCVNVGTPSAQQEKYAAIVEGAAAHNRLVLEDSDVPATDGWLERLQTWPDMADGDSGYVMTYSVEVGSERLSLVRGFRLSKDGKVFDGFDRIVSGANGRSIAIHFHLPAAIKMLNHGDAFCSLETHLGRRWRVSAEGALLTVVPSVQMAHPAGRQASLCIRLGFSGVDGATAAWRWAQEAG
ncbi:MAG: heparinase II/III family protein [Pseudomonadota bacterium]